MNKIIVALITFSERLCKKQRKIEKLFGRDNEFLEYEISILGNIILDLIGFPKENFDRSYYQDILWTKGGKFTYNVSETIDGEKKDIKISYDVSSPEKKYKILEEEFLKIKI